MPSNISCPRCLSHCVYCNRVDKHKRDGIVAGVLLGLAVVGLGTLAHWAFTIISHVTGAM